MLDLRALIDSETPPANNQPDDPLILCILEPDEALAYVFESASWVESIGASKQLAALIDRLCKTLPPGSAILSADSSRIVAFIPAGAYESHSGWQSALVRIAPEITSVATLSIGVLPLTVHHVFGGLYRTPSAVIGIPGMNVHQMRVNRYYGLDSGSTIPPPDRIAARRHFGEVLALARHLTGRSRENRLIFPFYDCLPPVIRCTSCRTRPAEHKAGNELLCGVCARKRMAAGDPAGAAEMRRGAILSVFVPGIDTLLNGQRSPAAYRRLALKISETWQKALLAAERPEARLILLTKSSSEVWLLVPAGEGTSTAARLCQTLAAANLPGSTAVCVGLAFGTGGAQAVYKSGRRALTEAIGAWQRTPTASAISLRMADRLDFPGDSTAEGLSYTPETLEHLSAAVRTLRTGHFPAERFADLPVQLARQTASLYYSHILNRLESSTRHTLDPIVGQYAALWGKDTPRFFHALADTFALLTFLAENKQSREKSAP